jgi:ubiquitin carboxyl-terminal hydrolase 10
VHTEVLPSVLVLHLNRFLYDAAADGVVKISKPIQFTPWLQISPGTSFSFVFRVLAKAKNSSMLHGSVSSEIMAPVSGKSAEPVNYKLYGVLYHHGESAGSGHYTVDVLHPNGDGSGGEGWLHIDDEVVSAAQREEMFGSHANERDDGCAYMLFYCRTASEKIS